MNRNYSVIRHPVEQQQSSSSCSIAMKENIDAQCCLDKSQHYPMHSKHLNISRPLPIMLKQNVCASDVFSWTDFPCADQRAALTRLIVEQALADASNSSNGLFLHDTISCRSQQQQQQQQQHVECKEEEPQNSGRKVRFSEQVQIREHATIMGCHPWARLPLELGWDYTETAEQLPTEDDTIRRRRIGRWSFEERKELFDWLLSKRMRHAKVSTNSSSTPFCYSNVPSFQSPCCPQRVQSQASNLFALGNPGVEI